jgi:hypothetical protein
MTNLTNQHRRDAIAKSLEVYKTSGQKKTESIEYRGKDTPLEVITIKPEFLLLNHDNSRLSAQLFDHPKRAIVEQQPTSDEAQKVLTELLRSTEQYPRLRDELKAMGQLHVGLISRDGLLINGNTRVAALREIGVEGVEVAVLPEDAVSSDFLDLEMSLQMRRLTHQDYTFTNELLLMDKYRNFGHTDKQLAKKMGWIRRSEKKLAEATQLLNLVKEIRSQSNPPIAFSVFDRMSQHLKDLNTEYQVMALTDFREAESMKWGRVAAMFLGINKDQTRAIDDAFYEEDVVKRLDGDPAVVKYLDDFKKVEPPDDGLGPLVGEPDDHEKIDTRSFATNVISQLLDETGHIAKDLTPELQKVREAIRVASDAIIIKGKRKEAAQAPSEILSETTISLEEVVMQFAEVSKLPGFDPNRFEFHLDKVHKSLKDLTKEYEKFKAKGKSN